jgi:hypothetical protein
LPLFMRRSARCFAVNAFSGAPPADPKGYVTKCGDRLCVRPDHLHSRKLFPGTHCSKGHPLIPANFRSGPSGRPCGYRRCLSCTREGRARSVQLSVPRIIDRVGEHWILRDATLSYAMRSQIARILWTHEHGEVSAATVLLRSCLEELCVAPAHSFAVPRGELWGRFGSRLGCRPKYTTSYLKALLAWDGETCATPGCSNPKSALARRARPFNLCSPCGHRLLTALRASNRRYESAVSRLAG